MFKVFTTSDLAQVVKANNQDANGTLQFFDHRVGDRFFRPLLKQRTDMIFQGDPTKRAWLLDDMHQAPPYDPDRFTTGLWRHNKANQDAINPRVPEWLPQRSSEVEKR